MHCISPFLLIYLQINEGRIMQFSLHCRFHDDALYKFTLHYNYYLTTQFITPLKTSSAVQFQHLFIVRYVISYKLHAVAYLSIQFFAASNTWLFVQRMQWHFEFIQVIEINDLKVTFITLQLYEIYATYRRREFTSVCPFLEHNTHNKTNLITISDQ